MARPTPFILLLLVLIFASSVNVHAQMMNNPITTTDNSQTTKDEVAGKAVWDKLQNKQVLCKDLKDDDFDVLGDFFMGNMVGSRHSTMNQMMAQRLGDNGEKQMHIALGKRLSGCDINISLPQGASYFMPMMGFSGGTMNNWHVTRNSFGIFGLLTWISLLTFLILGSIFFFKQIQKKK